MPTRIMPLDELAAFSKREVERHGLIADPYITSKNCPQLQGLNLACSYPLPEELATAYESLANKLRSLGDFIYVYPPRQIHITLLTLIDFAKTINLTKNESEAINDIGTQLNLIIKDAIYDCRCSPFSLQFERPLMSSRAIFIPISNPGEEVNLLRSRLMDKLKQKQRLVEHLKRLGLKNPGIIHTTIARYKSSPTNVGQSLFKFNELTQLSPLGSTRVSEIIVTLETKPYMLAGTVLKRFSLVNGASTTQHGDRHGDK